VICLGVALMLGGIAVGALVWRAWRADLALRRALDEERRETLQRHRERRQRESFSEWPFPPRGE